MAPENLARSLQVDLENIMFTCSQALQKKISKKAEQKYYEIIGHYSGEVIGVCCNPNDVDETNCIFGEITEAEYQKFSELDNGWNKPISKKKFKLEAAPKILVEI